MTLDSLKEDYLKTLTEPRLSGKSLPEKVLQEIVSEINSTNTLDEFVKAVESISMGGDTYLRNTERHILLRILTWNDQPPVDEKGNRITNK